MKVSRKIILLLGFGLLVNVAAAQYTQKNCEAKWAHSQAFYPCNREDAEIIVPKNSPDQCQVATICEYREGKGLPVKFRRNAVFYQLDDSLKNDNGNLVVTKDVKPHAINTARPSQLGHRGR